tara:strand:+ start:3304 stop:4677 length:1374 start_codon:yes stop_codon:yes gene_type:complete
MSKLLQLRGGTTSQHNSFTGAVREVTVDTDKDTLIVHDGSTQGGFELAKIASPALTGNPTAPTQSVNNNSTRIATTAYADAAAAAVVDSAPSTLNTLNELAAALGDDPNYATTTTNAIAAKLPLAGGAMTGAITSAGDLNFDVASDIVLDADGGKIKFRDNGTDIAYLENSSGDLLIKSITDDKDIKIQGKDGGSFITACTFDMSNAGAATFNNYIDLGTNNIYTGDNGKAVFGSGEDLQIYHNGTDSYIKDTGAGDLYIQGSSEVQIESTSGENMIRCVENGAVELYNNNAKKLNTYASGVEVTGNVYATGAFGKDGGDKISFSDNSHIDFNVNNATEMRLEADGDLHVDGDVIAYSTTISDERLKDNIEVVEGALDKVKELKGVTFTRKQDGQESAGVIAQDVEKVLPQAIKHKALPLQTGDDGLFMTVQYDALHALLIESIKELSARVEELENK